MPKRYIKMAFQEGLGAGGSYKTDVGNYDLEKTAGFYAPRALVGESSTFFSDLAESAGGALIKDLQGGFDEEEAIPCNEGSLVIPRKLQVIFDDGSSTAIPLNATAAGVIKDYAQDVWTKLKAKGAICANLIGEELTNLNEVLGVNFQDQPIPSGGVGRYYSGKINYYSDLEKNIVIPVKTLSQVPDTPPPIFETAWQSCVQDFIDNRFSCPKLSSNVKHRRFKVDYVVDPPAGQSGNRPESRELPINPIAGQKRANVRACGTVLASSPSVFCIGYFGESQRFIHRSLA